jgi:peptide deformylase
MTIRKILYASDPRLRQKAKKVKDFGPHLKKLADDMLETMRQANGVGLAGPQIGVMQRIFVAEIPVDQEDPNSGQSYVIVNPELTYLSEEIEEGQEGCLSIPNWYGLVNRHRSVQIKAKDVHGKNIRLTVDGFLGRIFQHEYDHLNGVLFIDHITDKEKLWQVLPEETVEGEQIEDKDTTEASPAEVEATATPIA